MKALIAKLVAGESLDAASMEQAMEAVLRGEASPVQIAALVVALRMKGETVDEITAAARVMRRHAVPVPLALHGPIVDTCGTGGDGADSFNISTVAAIVVAACGVTVAKHGGIIEGLAEGGGGIRDSAAELTVCWPFALRGS